LREGEREREREEKHTVQWSELCAAAGDRERKTERVKRVE